MNAHYIALHEYLRLFDSSLVSKILTNGFDIFCLFVVSLLAVWLVFKESNRGSSQHRARAIRLCTQYVVGGTILLLFVLFLKYFTGVTRPAAELGVSIGLLDPVSSFPSAHAALFVYIGLILEKKIHKQWLVVAGWVFVSSLLLARIVVGYHSLLDILVGAGLGWLMYRMVRNN